MRKGRGWGGCLPDCRTTRRRNHLCYSKKSESDIKWTFRDHTQHCCSQRKQGITDHSSRLKFYCRNIKRWAKLPETQPPCHTLTTQAKLPPPPLSPVQGFQRVLGIRTTMNNQTEPFLFNNPLLTTWTSRPSHPTQRQQSTSIRRAQEKNQRRSPADE